MKIWLSYLGPLIVALGLKSPCGATTDDSTPFPPPCHASNNHYQTSPFWKHDQFILCNSGQALRLQCPKEQVFNTDQERCESPKKKKSRPKRHVIWPGGRRSPPWAFHGSVPRSLPYNVGPLCLTSNPDCTFFYRCNTGFGIFSNCLNRTQFEVVVGSCYNAQIIPCRRYLGNGAFNGLVPTYLIPLLTKQQTTAAATAAAATTGTSEFVTIPTLPSVP